MNYYPAIGKDLQQIVEMLLLNGTLTEDPGLVHGKMGIAVFLFHYARYTKNMLFEDYAMDLIGEMQNQLYANSCADYEKGVAGIGVGIGYLIQNNYLDAEDDIFEDLDTECFRPIDYLLENEDMCFWQEPVEHNVYPGIALLVVNAFMASRRGNEGMCNISRRG